MRVWGIAALAAAVALGACDTRVADAKAMVSRDMRDPDAAKFRDVEAKAQAVCGQVNGKNGFGAYVGFKRFIVADGKAQIEPDRTEIDRSSLEALEASALGVGREADFKEQWNRVC